MSRSASSVTSFVRHAMGTLLALALFPGALHALTADQINAEIETLLAELASLRRQLDAVPMFEAEGYGQSTFPAVSALPAAPAIPTAGLPVAGQFTGFAPQAVCPRLYRTLSFGSSGEDVRKLQQFLASDRSVYPEALATGYFGSLTRRAVERFQQKYDIVYSGTPETTGYGLVGPRTRAMIGARCGASAVGAGAAYAPGQTAPMCPFVPLPPTVCSTGWQPVVDPYGCVSLYKCSFSVTTRTSSTVSCPAIRIPSCAKGEQVVALGDDADGCPKGHRCVAISACDADIGGAQKDAAGRNCARQVRTLRCPANGAYLYNGLDDCQIEYLQARGWTADDAVSRAVTFTASPSSGNAPLTVNFGGTAYSAENYTVNFGDGQVGAVESTCLGGGAAFACGIGASHTYTSSGTYTASVRDGAGVEQAKATVSVSAP